MVFIPTMVAITMTKKEVGGSMKPLRQPTMLWRLGLVTLTWILVQLLLLPNAIHQNAAVLSYSGYALIALLLVITVVDGYRILVHQLDRCFIGIDLVTLVVVGLLLLLPVI